MYDAATDGRELIGKSNYFPAKMTFCLLASSILSF